MTTTSPAVIDTRIAELNSELARTRSQIDYQRGQMHDLAGDNRRKRTMVFVQAIRIVKDKYPTSYERIMTSIKEAEAKVESLRAELAPLNAAYEAERWSRFYLVPGGHIHSSMYCSTCNKVTSKRGDYSQSLTNFTWLTDLSGLTEEDAVKAHGALLCTVCYPTAPVHWTNALEEAAKARKAAQCPGSGTYLDRNKPYRTGYYSGNWGTCPECDARPSVTSTGKLRAHKPEKN